MKRFVGAVAMVALLGGTSVGLGGCSGLSKTEQRTLSGGAIGAAAGTVGAVIVGGGLAVGAAVGGVAGLAAGYIYDQVEKDKAQ